MSRITDAVLAKDEVFAGHSPALKLVHGGQNGWLPRIGQVGADGKNYEEWISNHAYIKKNVIPVVIRYPKFMDFMPNSADWIATYKALIELHPLSIEGLSSGLTVEFDEHAVGGAGEMQEELTNVTRARSTISHTYKEKAGKSIQKFLDYYIRYGMMDPDVKKPLVTEYINSMEDIGGMYTPDYYTGTVLYIEPDTTHKVVVDAWLCSNMAPKGNGDRTGKRDLRSAGEAPELSVEFTSITMNNEAVLAMADTILASLTVINDIPDTELVLPSSEVDQDVAAADVGFNSKN